MKQRMLYNRYMSCIIELRGGEEFCEKCKGDGEIYPKNGMGFFNRRRPLCCNECDGTGKIDWVEKATGKKRNGS